MGIACSATLAASEAGSIGRSWRASPDLPKSAVGDETRLRQILTNLLGNAIKFTETGGVALTLRLVTGAAQGGKAWLRFAVRDTGPGVPAEAIGRIFDEFEQAESGPARRHGGTGLGLAISRSLVEARGGRLWLDVGNRGSTFSFTLPIAGAAP